MERKSFSKKIIILLIGFIVSVCCFSALNFVFRARGEADLQQFGGESGSTAAYNSFYMEDGAGVRISDTSGIKWTTNYTKTWVNSLYIDDGTVVKMGTLVTAAHLVENDETKLTFDNIDTYSISNITTYSQNGLTAEDGSFYSSVVYDNVSASNQAAAYGTELIARSYVIFISGGTEFTVYADVGDTQRSMRGVAVAAKCEGDDRVNGYLGMEETGVSLVDAAVELSEKSNSLELTDNSSGYNAAYIGSKKIGTVTGTAIIIDNVYTLGKGTLTLFNDSGDYAKVSFIEPTICLGSKEEFIDAMSIASERLPILSSNYKLTANIDLGTLRSGAYSTLSGTFDGNGHTITISTAMTSAGGVFNYIDGGTVKNLKLVENFRYNQAGGAGLLVNQIQAGATANIENVYIEYTNGNITYVSFYYGTIARSVSGTLNLTDVVTYCKTELELQSDRIGSFVGIVRAGGVLNMKDCYSISEKESVPAIVTDEAGVDLTNLKAYGGEAALSEFSAAVEQGEISLSDTVKAMVLVKEPEEDDPIYDDGSLEPYIILIPASAGDTSDIEKAAASLRSKIYEATGKNLSVMHDDKIYSDYTSSSRVISLGNTTYWEKSGVKLPEDINYYGYIIKKTGNSYFINSPTEEGVAFGAYRYLKEAFNYDCLSDQLYTIKKGQLGALQIDLVEKGYATETSMSTLYRGSAFLDGEAMQAMGYLDRNTGVYGLNVPGSSSDPVSQQIPYNTYAKSHPDWYYIPSSGNKGQFCYTAHGNEAEYAAIVNKAAEVLESQLKNLDTRYVRFSLKDNKFWCDCNACTLIKDTYGSESATLIMFINDVAKKIDDWMAGAGSKYAHYYEIQYLLYQRTIKPPYNALEYNASNGTATVKSGYEKVIPAPHTLPIYASMRSNYHLSPNDSYNAEFKKQIICWQALTNEGNTGFGVWSYFVNLKNYIMFYDSFTYMSEWYKLYAQGGNTTWFYEEGTSSTSYYQDASLGYGATAWTALRNYLSANLAKNTSLDQTALTEKFFKAYYGEGWREMLAVYNATLTKFNDFRSASHLTYNVNARSSYAPNAGTNGKTNYENMGTNHEDAYPTYFDLTKLNWTYDFVNTALGNINAALGKVTDEQIKKNIKAERFSYEYMMIELYGFEYTANGGNVEELKKQAKADAEENNFDNNVSGGSNGLKLAEVWGNWGLS